MISFVNSAEVSFSGTGAGTLTTPAFNLAAGNLVIVSCRLNIAVATVPTDTAGNTYTLISSTVGAGFHYVWYAYNTSANASNQVSLTVTNRDFMNLMAAQYSGATTSNPLQGSNLATRTASGGSLTSGTFSTDADTGAIIAIAQTANNVPTWTPGTGFTTRQVQSSWAHVITDDLTAVANLVNTTSSISHSPNSGNTSLITAWFKDATPATNNTNFFLST